MMGASLQVHVITAANYQQNNCRKKQDMTHQMLRHAIRET